MQSVDPSSSLTWGVLTSMFISTLKYLGLEDKWVTGINYVVGLFGSCIYVFSQTHDWHQSIIPAILAFGSSHGFYQSVGKPISNLVKKNGN